MADFPCTSCGLCCKMVGLWVKGARAMKKDGKIKPDSPLQEVVDFPHKINPDGACSKLGADGRCTIYETRPLICHIEKMWEKYNQDEITLADYYAKAGKSCNRMIIENKLDKKFLVPL